ATPLSRAARDVAFSFHRGEYEALIARVEQRAIPKGQPERITLSDSERSIAYFVLAERAADGSLIVEILTGGGFPVKHSGYVFASAGSFPSESFIGKRWEHHSEVESNWYRVSD